MNTSEVSWHDLWNRKEFIKNTFSLWISGKKCSTILLSQLDDKMALLDNSKTVSIRWTNGEGKQSKLSLQRTLVYCNAVMQWVYTWTQAALSAMATIPFTETMGLISTSAPTHFPFTHTQTQTHTLYIPSDCNTKMHITTSFTYLSFCLALDTHQHAHHTHTFTAGFQC